MSYFLSEEQELIRKAAKEFAETEIKPKAKELDETHEFPWDWVNECAELGFLGVSIPEKYGGAGADCLSEMLIIEEIAKYSGSLALIIDAHTSLGCMPLLHDGTEEQKQKYLIPAAKGEKLMSFGLTEPGAGSDAGGTQTTAVLDGDEWVLNGTKCWITNIGAAKTYIVTAKTDLDKGNRGISAFIVEAGTPGFEVGKPERKMGLNNSNTGDLYFKNCRIRKENLLGKLNKGFPVFLRGLDEGRLAISAMAVGMAQGALELATVYAKERVQFGKPISSFQGISFKLAEMAINIEAARTMLYNAARLRDAGLPYSKEAAMVKAFSSEMCVDACDKSLQIHGGNGYSKELEIERYYRDAKLLTIGEGTSEINRMVIANHLLA
ncbi:acyl-CoA dehydrogenase family protein [Bacillus sp. B15-48]|uniref:acyl-CoA dehydrogenase family protein n=1 Tax=Bacillus sp. B15-48 TaxID=1548601 RepID=UPI00193ED19B|nr:acyl-CoA dehydrogenase family protein [Bacillus sp. B15-48]MBM4764282.1 acyl-CoA dehydrogenase [Bacillus sp. B15-48]